MILDAEKLFVIEANGTYGGDRIEKKGWPLFGKKKFPNYEKFWQLFIVPKTNRTKDVHFNSATTPEERAICSIHYAIFSNFYYNYRNLQNTLSEESFELSFIKLSNSCDLLEELLFRVLTYYELVDGNNVLNKVKKIELKLDNDKKIIKEFSKSGRYSVRVIDRLYFIKKHFTVTEYLKLSGQIRIYRNVIAHSWQSFQVNGMVPTVESVQENLDWLRVTDILKSNDHLATKILVKKEFIKRDDLVKEHTGKLIAIINSIWEELIPMVPKDQFQDFSGKTFAETINNLTIGDSASYSETFPVTTTTTSGTASVQMSAGMRTSHDK